MSRYFPESELIIQEDGSAFHLRMKPEQLADKVILVGDPARLDLAAPKMEVESRTHNREFHSLTGWYKGKRITFVSVGIGTDNVDIVLNELDSLANIDYATRTEKPVHRCLDIVRIGTCGGLQADLPAGTMLISEKSIGTDGMLNYYAERNEVCDLEFEKEFCRQMNYLDLWARPYVVSSSPELIERIGQGEMALGVTVTTNGFYGPQGRQLRGHLAMEDYVGKLRAFRYGRHRITNFEMESAGVEGMAAMLGHRAMTVCLIIVNRYAQTAQTDYHNAMEELVTKVLDRI